MGGTMLLQLRKDGMYIAALVVLLLAGNGKIDARSAVIRINSQQEFDRMQQLVIDAVSSGADNVTVELGDGSYLFHEKHFVIYGRKWADVSLTIRGEGCVIAAAGASGKKAYSPYCALLDKDGDVIDPWSEMLACDRTVRIDDPSTGLCMLRCSSLPAVRPRRDNPCILLTQWYTSGIYQARKISGDSVVFLATDLSRDGMGRYSVNGDHTYGRSMPRFRVLRDTAGLGVSHVCDATSFMEISTSSLGGFKMEGIRFIGNRGAHTNEYLVKFYETDFPRATVKGCSFKGIASGAVGIQGSDNVTVAGNTFTKCFSTCICSYGGSRNTVVSDNVFEDTGLFPANSFCVSCSGENYLISGNNFTDYGYGAISAGLHYALNGTCKSSGIVEGNVLVYRDDYLAPESLLMDSGAIYVNSVNSSLVIRYNRISGYWGMKDNRGIFCDDGARNVDIYGNVITGIRNSYSIDSRRVSSVEKQIGASNVNNHIHDNLIDNPIRLQGRNKGGCTKGMNFVLVGTGGKAPSSVCSDLESQSDDMTVSSYRSEGKTLHVSRSTYNTLRRKWKHFGKMKDCLSIDRSIR